MVRSRSDRPPGRANQGVIVLPVRLRLPSNRSEQTVSRGKVTRSWRCLLRQEHRRHANRHKSTVLFFVRVNQVLVRLWARAMEAGHGPVFVPPSG